MTDFESSNFDQSTSEAEAKKAFATNRLNERVDQLMKENTMLRSQFEEAITLTNQVEDLHKDNASLLGQIRDLKTEKDDLNHRLDILAQKDKETTARLKNEKNTSTSQRGTDLSSMNKEIEKIKAQSKAQIDSIYEQLEQAEQAREKENVEKRLLIRKLDNVIADAGRFFDTSFNNIEDVLGAFKSNKGASTQGSQINSTIGQSAFQSRSNVQQSSMMAPKSPQQQQQQQQSEQQLQDLHKKIRRLKKQISEKDEQFALAEEEKNKQSREFEKIKRAKDDQIAELSEQVTLTNNQIQRDADQYNHNLSQYEAKINSMKIEMEKEKKKCKKANEERKTLKRQIHNLQLSSPLRQQQQQQQERAVSMNTSDSDSGSANDSAPSPRSIQPRAHPTHYSQDFQLDQSADQLITQKAELQEQLNQSNKKKEQLAKLLQQRDQQIHDLQIETEKIRNDLNALKTVYDEQHHEVETLRAALVTREDAKEKIKETEPKEVQPNPRVVKLQKALEDQKQKFYQLQITADKKDTQIQQLQLDLKHLAQKAEDAEHDAERAHSETKDLRTSMLTNSQPAPEDVIPASAFRCNEFPPDLSSKVAKIANNHSLQPISKIQNSYKVIRKYFMQQVTMRDSALDEAYSENQTISNAVNQFLVDASIAIDDQPITFKDFFSQNAGKDLVDKIQVIRAENSDLHHENEQMKAVLSQMRETFIEIGDGQDPQTHIFQIKDRYDALQADLAATSKKMKSYKSQLKKCEQQAKKNEQQLKQSIEELRQENDVLSQHQQTATKQLQDLKQENQRLTVELSDVTHTREDLESTIIQDHEEQVQQRDNQYKEQIDNYKKQLRSQKQTYDQLEADYQALAEELDNTRKQCTALKSQKAAKDAETNDLQKLIEENKRNAAERLESEKAHLAETYRSTIDKLHEQCEKHREDVKQINIQLADKEIQVANLKAQVAKITKEKLRAINDMSQMKDTLKREQKLMETTIRSNKAQAESDYNQKLDEFRIKLDGEKRTLYAYGIDAFRNYFNPGSSIDEKSFKQVIDKANEKIVKLEKSDASVRMLANAGKTQTTEDAVAQLLL